MLFPFLPFMTHDFFPDLNRQEIGKKLLVRIFMFVAKKSVGLECRSSSGPRNSSLFLVS